MTTFLERFDDPGGTPPDPAVTRVAVKDLVDLAGHVTTAGCRAVAESAAPATADAPLLAGIRAAEARGEVHIVGKVNLHELAYGSTGINPWYGTPVNPLGADLVPGGSSSGSAVVVAAGDADVAIGTDTGGSVRIPSACCGTCGLKTTYDRIDRTGVWPLSVSLDTVGPMARDVAGLVTGMALLEPGFTVDVAPATRVGRVRVANVDPVVDAAVDRALAAAGFEVVEVADPGWVDAWGANFPILAADAWEADRHLLDAHRDLVSPEVVTMLEHGATFTADALAAARDEQQRWRDVLAERFAEVDVLALPTMPGLPPTLDTADTLSLASLMAVANLTGVPALAMPVPADADLPASLQLLAPHDGEALLLATAAVIEAALV